MFLKFANKFIHHHTIFEVKISRVFSQRFAYGNHFLELSIHNSYFIRYVISLRFQHINFGTTSPTSCYIVTTSKVLLLLPRNATYTILPSCLTFYWSIISCESTLVSDRAFAWKKLISVFPIQWTFFVPTPFMDAPSVVPSWKNIKVIYISSSSYFVRLSRSETVSGGF